MLFSRISLLKLASLVALVHVHVKDNWLRDRKKADIHLNMVGVKVLLKCDAARLLFCFHLLSRREPKPVEVDNNNKH